MKQDLIQLGGKFYNECDVVMLPTEKATSIVFNTINNRFLFDKSKTLVSRILPIHGKNQHLYFLLNEEIKIDSFGNQDLKIGEWVFSIDTKEFGQISHIGGAFNFKGTVQFPANDDLHTNRHCTFNLRKIIGTTDESLSFCPNKDILNGCCSKPDFCEVPQNQLARPSDDFLKKYCELGGIDKVLVEYESVGPGFHAWYDVKVADDNTISIKPVEIKMYTKKEVEVIKLNAFEVGRKLTQDGWEEEDWKDYEDL